MRYQRAEQFAERLARPDEIKSDDIDPYRGRPAGRISVHMPFHILISRRKHTGRTQRSEDHARMRARFAFRKAEFRAATRRIQSRADVQQCTATAAAVVNLMRGGSVLCPSRGNNTGVPELSRLFLRVLCDVPL
jgi:hypothetical protein